MAQVFNEQFSGSSLDTTKWDSSAPAKVSVSGGSAVLTTNALNDQTTIYTKQINSSTGLYQQAIADGSYTLMETKVTPQGQKSGSQAYDLSFIATKYTVSKGIRTIGFQLFANTGSGASTLYRIRPYSSNQGVYNIGIDTATFTVNNPIWLRAKVTSRGAGILEYSLNGSSWTVIEIERDGFFYDTSDIYPQVIHNTFSSGASATALVDYVTLDVEEPVAVPSTAPSTGMSGGFGTFGFGSVYAGEVFSGVETNIDLVTSDTTHSHDVSNVALTQLHNISIQNASHTNTVTSPSLVQVINLATASTSHSLSSDNVVLTSGLSLILANSSHGLSSDNLTVTQVHGLVSQNTSHTLTSDNVTAVESKTLSVQNNTISQTTSAITLNEIYTLVLSNTSHTLSSDNLIPVQHAILGIDNNSISLNSDNISPILEYTLLNIPDSSTISLATDTASIQHQYILLIDNSTISQLIRVPIVTELNISEFEIGIIRPSGIEYGTIQNAGIDSSGAYVPSGIIKEQYSSTSVDEEGIYRV